MYIYIYNFHVLTLFIYMGKDSIHICIYMYIYLIIYNLLGYFIVFFKASPHLPVSNYHLHYHLSVMQLALSTFFESPLACKIIFFKTSLDLLYEGLSHP